MIFTVPYVLWKSEQVEGLYCNSTWRRQKKKGVWAEECGNKNACEGLCSWLCPDSCVPSIVSVEMTKSYDLRTDCLVGSKIINLKISFSSGLVKVNLIE